MRALRLPLLLASLSLASAGCAHSAASGGRAARTAPRLDAQAIAAWDRRAPPRRSTVAARWDAAQQRRQRARAAPRRVRHRARRIDVRFHRAGLHHAIELLADEARVSVVVDESLRGEVSLRLRRVDPLEALYALAEAHGAQVRRQGEVLILARR